MKQQSIKDKTPPKKMSYIFINIMIIVLVLVTSGFLFKKSIYTTTKYNLGYTEKSNINYQVCLKENEFYEQKCLDRNMKYIASLIDKIYINLDYTFMTDQVATTNYKYSIMARVVIADKSNSNNIFFSKDYKLLKEIEEDFKNTKLSSINKIIDIDYNKYNTLANRFKATYGIDSAARLELHMSVNNDTIASVNENLKYTNNARLLVSIPLSENALNIKIDNNSLNNVNNIYYHTNNGTGNRYYFYSSIALVLVALLLIVRFILHFIKHDKYKQLVSRLLREYDRVIVESKTTIDIKKFNVIEVKNFDELLDVHDNLKLPIIFNNIKKGQKCQFYIKLDSDLYLFTIKATDLGDLNEKKDKEE